MLELNELERTDLLQMAFLTSALKKTLKKNEKERNAKSYHEAMIRGKQLIASMLTGTLLLPREERQKLIPEGVWLNESVLAYSYAQKAWEAANITIPRSENEVLGKLRLYVHCFEKLDEQKPLEPAELGILDEIKNFFENLENILVGELNSKRAEAMSYPF